jgi:hypothetical protein
LSKTLWVEYLEDKGICHMDPLTENMPCDDGAICDKCHVDTVQRRYTKWLEHRVRMLEKKQVPTSVQTDETIEELIHNVITNVLNTPEAVNALISLVPDDYNVSEECDNKRGFVYDYWWNRLMKEVAEGFLTPLPEVAEEEVDPD